MAIGLIFDGQGLSQDQYFQVFNQVTRNGTQRAPGMISHHAGATSDGFCVVEIWESQEALQNFFETELGAAMQAAKIEAQPKVFEIFNTL